MGLIMMREKIFFIVLAFGCMTHSELAASDAKSMVDRFVALYKSDPSFFKELGLIGLSHVLSHMRSNSIDLDWMRLLVAQVDNENLLPRKPIVDCNNICKSNELFESWFQKTEEIYEKRRQDYEQKFLSYSKKNSLEEEFYKPLYKSHIEYRIKISKRNNLDKAREEYDERVNICLFDQTFDKFMHEINEKNYQD